MKPVISFADWQGMDVRLGAITAASNPEWSNKLIELRVDFGELGERSIFTGLRAWYQPTDFVGRQALFIVNLQPRPMGPSVSEGMLLSLDTKSTDGNLQPTVLWLENLAPAGTSVV